jgi:hypothetical protein
MSFLEVGLGWRKWVAGDRDMSLKTISCCWPLPFTHLCFLVRNFPLPCPFSRIFCLIIGLKAIEPADHGLNSPKLLAKIKLSSLKLLFLGYFVTAKNN